ncbi:gamma-glutamyltransferase family protein [Flagellimonas nanhaiensis]|nr:gamma-glutamyltransferase [Allomuricauda nanhaiensis]
MDFNFIRKWVVGYLVMIMVLSCSTKEKNVLGVVSSATPEASKVGEQILKMGGNSFDAAVAVSFALAVTEPAMSGLGGGTQILLSTKNQTPVAINGTTFSPRGTLVDSQDTLSYHRRSTVPSTVKVLDYLYRNYGSGNVSWEELLQPAIELAEKGYEVGPFRSKVYQKYGDRLKSSPFGTDLFLLQGEVPKSGQKIKQQVLAKTLRRLATHGADDFYKGEIANTIAEDMQKNGGWISLKDLEEFPEPKVLEPLTIQYGEHRVYSQPPPCGGWTALLILELLEQKIQNQEWDKNALIEALYLGQNDRRLNPVTDLIEYDSLVETKLGKDHIEKLMEIGPDSIKVSEVQEKKTGETTHFSIVDNQGNAIAVTASINAYFGSLAASEKLGFLYNSYMDDFVFEKPEHPFALRPNAMAYSSMSPTIVQKNAENVLVIGSPGSSRIISTVAQLTAKWINQKDITALISSNRIHVNRKRVYLEKKSDTLEINNDLIKKYDLEFRVPDESLILKDGLNPYYGGVHAIAKEDSVWIGAADPRRDGLYITVFD